MNSLQSSRKRRPAMWLFVSVLIAWQGAAYQNAVAVDDKSLSTDQVRESVLAGSWYPAAPEELRRQIEGFLGRVPPTDMTGEGQLLALISPHAGYVYSGQVAAYAYKLLERQKFPNGYRPCPKPPCPLPGGFGL